MEAVYGLRIAGPLWVYFFVIENAFIKELADSSKWLKVNKLSLNITKTHYMIFSRKKANHQLDLRIDNQKIDETSTTKFLGVNIDSKLNWKTHISYIWGEIARGIGVLVKARMYFENDCMIKLYNAFIYLYLMYCNHIVLIKQIFENYKFYRIRLFG